MSQENRISYQIPAATLTGVVEQLNAILTALKDVLVFNLTAEERQSLRIMGDKTLAFVQKSLEYAESNRQLCPSYLDLPEGRKDFELTHDLYTILQKINTLQRAVEDAMMVSGSEAYDAALVFYNSVKGASRVNVPGSEAVYNDLHQRFAVKPKKAENK
jgi:hypothetical protein